MSRLIFSLIVALSLVPPRATAGEMDPLQNTLWQLRRFARVIDPYEGERRVMMGESLMQTGQTGVGLALDLRNDDDGDSSAAAAAVIVIALIGLVAVGVGVASVISGTRMQMATPPRGNLSRAQYMTTAGLDEFMRLEFEQQYAIARQDPEFANFLQRLSAAFDTAVQYGLIATPTITGRRP